MAPKLYVIVDRKEPTPAQMMKMVRNLHNHCGPDIYFNIGVQAKKYSTRMEEMVYTLYEADAGPTQEFETWPELLAYYHKRMNNA